MTRMVRRGRSYKSLQATGAGGRFVRNTLENTLGLRMLACPHCRIGNPYGPDEAALNHRFPIVRWVEPTHCHACGQPLTEDGA